MRNDLIGAEEDITIDPDLIPDDVYDAMFGALDSSVRQYFAMPGVWEKYEKWLEDEYIPHEMHRGKGNV